MKISWLLYIDGLMYLEKVSAILTFVEEAKNTSDTCLRIIAFFYIQIVERYTKNHVVRYNTLKVKEKLIFFLPLEKRLKGTTGYRVKFRIRI